MHPQCRSDIRPTYVQKLLSRVNESHVISDQQKGSLVETLLQKTEQHRLLLLLFFRFITTCNHPIFSVWCHHLSDLRMYPMVCYCIWHVFRGEHHQMMWRSTLLSLSLSIIRIASLTLSTSVRPASLLSFAQVNMLLLRWHNDKSRLGYCSQLFCDVLKS